MKAACTNLRLLCENERLSVHALPPSNREPVSTLHFRVCEKPTGTTLITATKLSEVPLACVTQTTAWLCPAAQTEALALICDYAPEAQKKQSHHQYQKLCRLYEVLGLGKPEPHQPVHPEACRLQPGGTDFFGRPFTLHPEALSAWQNMQQAARADGVLLSVISAYRSFSYQAELIRRKLAAGQKLGDILRVNAVPGASEHHSGCALDLHSPDEKDIPPLSEAFEETRAFEWLTQHAKDYGFYLSYPRGNPQGMIYEPWHWCYRLPVSA